MREIKLNINAAGWHDFRVRKNDNHFRALSARIMSRDDFTCQFCDFRAEKFQQIINLDNNYRNNVEQNLVCACVLCAQCQFIGSGNFGKIIYLPEYPQVELNNIIRAIFCATALKTQYSDVAKSIYRSFRNRAQHVEDTFGENSSDAIVFGQTVIDAGIDMDIQQNQAMSSLRLLPFKAPLTKPIQYWSTVVKSYWE